MSLSPSSGCDGQDLGRGQWQDRLAVLLAFFSLGLKKQGIGTECIQVNQKINATFMHPGPGMFPKSEGNQMEHGDEESLVFFLLTPAVCMTSIWEPVISL